jgi:G:T-mismatch repair DNA endonuclease (very short patch repair protein)
MFKVLVLWECWGKKNRINLIIIKKLKKLNKKKPEPEVIKKIK